MARYLSAQIVDDVAVLISDRGVVGVDIAFEPAEFVRFAFNEDERRIILVVDLIECETNLPRRLVTGFNRHSGLDHIRPGSSPVLADLVRF